MQQIHKERLQKLITFLETLNPARFDFGVVMNECGTIGCAMGWTPQVFPEIVEWTEDRNLHLKSSPAKWDWFEEVAQELFGMHKGTAELLFTPQNQSRVHADLAYCGYSSNPKQIADMLRQFLGMVESGSIDPSLPL